jgi:hypothetical protein
MGYCSIHLKDKIFEMFTFTFLTFQSVFINCDQNDKWYHIWNQKLITVSIYWSPDIIKRHVQTIKRTFDLRAPNLSWNQITYLLFLWH